MRVCWFVLCSVWGWSATTFEVNLLDGTHGGEGRADIVQLVRLEQGMEILVTLDQPEGRVSLTSELNLSGAQLLIQAIKGPAIYSERVPPGQRMVDLTVYDNVAEVETKARVGSLALYARGGSLDIGSFYNIDNVNKPPMTKVNEEETFRFPLIPGYKDVEASTRRGEMPLRQNLTFGDGYATMTYPLKPGRTQLVVHSSLDYSSQGENRVQIGLLPDQEFMHLLVLPENLEVAGDGVSFVDVDRREGVKLYEWARQEGQDQLELTISGASAEPGATPPLAQEKKQDEREYRSTPNHLGKYFLGIVSACLAFLGLLTFLAFQRP